MARWGFDAAQVARTAERFWALGGDIVDLAAGRLARHRTVAEHPLGTFLFDVRGGAGLAGLLDDAAGALGRPCSRVLTGPGTPPAVDAQLTLDGWAADRQLQLVLPASATVPRSGVSVHPVDGSDWDRVEALFRIDHVEEYARAGREPRPTTTTRAAVELRRGLGPEAEYFIDDSRSATIAVWVSDDGFGMIEDVFVHPEHRGRGVATAMLRHAVHRARERGAGPVLIGADPDDTPRLLYARFGFRPVCVTTSHSRPS